MAARPADLADLDFATEATASEDAEMEFDVGPGAEYIAPRQDLKRKVGTRKAKAGDLEPIAAAEAALAKMAASFDGWMEAETKRLADLWLEAEAEDYAGEIREAFHRAAHDIKGQAATLGFPIAGRIAGSLCRLLDGVEAAERLPRELVRQHVQSVRAIIVENAREETSPTARLLAERLDEVTDDFLERVAQAA